jgi:predicted peptidase
VRMVNFRQQLFAATIAWLGLNLALIAGADFGGRNHEQVRKPVSLQALERYESREQLLDSKRLIGSGKKIFSRLMRPEAPAAGRKYPLVLFLHGGGECGRDNVRQLRGLPEQLALADWRVRFPCFVLVPQCSETTSWSAWIGELEGLINRLCEELPVDRRRIYLTGLSMGGFGCWELAALRPDLFAAVVPICGGGDSAWGARLKAVPIWAVHGDADNVIPAERSRSMIEAIRKAGGQPRYTELSGVGHDSWTETYRDRNGVLRWMFEQVNSRLAD